MVDVSRLPPPHTAVWDWQMDAACRDIDSTTFFHPDHERGLAKDDRDRLAKAICSGCPVLEACRRHALIVQEPYGVWGGLTAAERAVLLHNSGSAAPGLTAPDTRIAERKAVTEPPDTSRTSVFPVAATANGPEDEARTASATSSSGGSEVHAAAQEHAGARVAGDAWFVVDAGTGHFEGVPKASRSGPWPG